ncbi:hypothetical protein H6503_03560 [Candidatus Woesearchaeota archaeon]|nr:hypothetical protein [Candidatus Woesearchaeota archaeon]
MVLSKQERYLLYALGKCYGVFNRRFSDKPLEVSISKSIFIDILISSKSIRIKPRAIYKNLESLEEKKYLRYKEKQLSFMKQGLSEFLSQDKFVQDYIDLIEHIKDPKTLHLHKRLQTRLKN